MKAALVTTAFLVIACSSGATAQQYDDPAIAACEFIMLEGRAAPEGYERTGASIDGLTVTIQYAVQVLNVAPRQREHTCQYKLRDNGKFSPVMPTNAEAENCKTEVDAQLSVANDTGKPRAERQAALDDTQRCQDIMMAEVRATAERLTNIYLPLDGMDLFSIPPDETALSAD